jgi:predicted dehydrogenase
MTSDDNKKASVLLVGCGAPLKSMGAYHALQILDGRVPDAELEYVVEPWYFSEASKSAPGYEEFHTWRKTLETDKGIRFFTTVAEVPPPKDGDIRLAIISARTADNPDLLKACVSGGCTAIYLEKPGATTVKDLEAMRDFAASKGVAVHMGFNKNVSSYLSLSMEFAKKHAGPAGVTFLHNNNYPNTTEALSECFERNAEGMLKNMAIHELAICVTYYGVTVDTIASVEADKEYSSLKTLGGFTDFDKIKFKITTKDGVSISVAADRCGGDDSVGIVTDASSGNELARFSMPDAETVSRIPSLKERYGDAMPYFFTQDPDYLELKNRVVQSVVHGKQADGVADINVAVETLKVAEYLTPILQEQLQ